MIRAAFFLSFLCSAMMLCGQSSFPKDFIGHWEGELVWYRTAQAKPQKTKMQLIIRPADTLGQYTWQIIYGEKNEDNRPYLMKPVDSAGIHWIVDERNGILLDQYWVGNRVTSTFKVQNITILDSYHREGKKLIAEFYMYSSLPIATTGGDKETPPVDSYETKAYQRAVMKRKR